MAKVFKIQERGVRWLTVDEIYEILTHHESVGIIKSNFRPSNISNGSIFLIDRQEVTDYKLDGIEWARKKGTNKLREEYVKLYKGGAHVITGLFTSAAHDVNIRRRIYRLTAENSTLVFIHYRDCSKELLSQMAKTLESAGSIYNLNVTQMYSSASSSPLLPVHSVSNSAGHGLGHALPSSTTSVVHTNHDCDTSRDLDLFEWINMVQDLPDLMVDSQGSSIVTGEAHQHHEGGVMGGASFGPAEHARGYGASPGAGAGTEAVSTLPQSKPIAVVADFCPCCDKAIGGSKMMVCSAGDFNAYNFAGNGLHVIFSLTFLPEGFPLFQLPLDSFVSSPTDIVTPSVVRCQVPAWSHSHSQSIATVHESEVKLRYATDMCLLQCLHLTLARNEITLPSRCRVTYIQGEVVASSCQLLFEYSFPDASSLVSELEHKLLSFSPIIKLEGVQSPPVILPPSVVPTHLDNFMETEPNHILALSVSPTKEVHSPLAPSLGASLPMAIPVHNRNKRRIVHRVLESVALLDESSRADSNSKLILSNHLLHSDGELCGDDDWLDDSALSALSTVDLEKLMELFLLRVVKQLVQLATSDDDLKAEIDALDNSGYSMLHYCCLFNMPSLVSKLVKKGANVNCRTTHQATAFHLAVGAGHIEVVKQLLDCNADFRLCNADGLNAIDLAVQIGNRDMIAILQKCIPVCDQSITPTELLSIESMHTVAEARAAVNQSTPSQVVPEGPLRYSSPSNSRRASWSSPMKNMSGRVGQSQDTGLDCGASGNGSGSGSGDADVGDAMEEDSSTVGGHITSENTSNENSIAANISLIYGALSALSLTDKCALSLSLGGNTAVSSISTMVHVSSEVQEDFEVQSVLSDTDKESLDHAMAMMSPTELIAVEEEVRKIQNNVRAWLLRKNYTNLRDAARTLQVAWRERKERGVYGVYVSPRSTRQVHPSTTAMGTATKAEDGDNSAETSVSDRVVDGAMTSDDISCAIVGQMPAYSHLHFQSQHRLRTSDEAASRLQAATRGMLARKSFQRVRMQTMASLVIQKSLFQWWVHKSGTNHIHHQGPS